MVLSAFRSSLARWGLSALLILIATLYVATLSVNHSEAEDSLWYLRAITYDPLPYQFHPNHLLYNWVNQLFYRGWQALGYTGDAELPVKLLNVAAGLVVLWLVYRLAAAARLPESLRLAAVALTAFSYGFWWYSVECETYIFPLVFALLALDSLLRVRADFTRWRGHLLVGLWTALAILFHQQHVLLIGVVLVGYLGALKDGAIGPGRWLGRVAACGAVCAGLVAAVYGLVLVLVYERTTLAAMWAWLLSASEAGGYGYGLSLGSLRAVLGFSRAFVGGHFVFAFPVVVETLTRVVPHYDLREEVFLVSGLTPMDSLALLGGTALGLATLAYALVRGLADRQPRASSAPMSSLLTAYIVLYAVFNTLYLPESMEVWIALVPVVALALAVAIRPAWKRRTVRVLMGLGLICLWAVNLWGSVLPQTDRNRDYWYQFNGWLIANAQPGDLVVSAAGYIADGYVAFYARARVLDALSAGSRVEQRFEQSLARYRPTRVFVSSTLVAPPRSVVGTVVFDRAPARALFEKLRPQLTLVHADAWQAIYEYHPRAP